VTFTLRRSAKLPERNDAAAHLPSPRPPSYRNESIPPPPLPLLASVGELRRPPPMRSAGRDERDGGNALTPTHRALLLPPTTERVPFPTPRLVLSPSNRFPRRPAGGFHLAVLALVSRLRRCVLLRHRIFLPPPGELHFPQRELPLFQLVARDRSFTRGASRFSEMARCSRTLAARSSFRDERVSPFQRQESARNARFFFLESRIANRLSIPLFRLSRAAYLGIPRACVPSIPRLISRVALGVVLRWARLASEIAFPRRQSLNPSALIVN